MSSVAVLVISILSVLILVLLGETLGYFAERNLLRYRELRPRLQKMNQALSRFRSQLSPYAKVDSRKYRTCYKEAITKLVKVKSVYSEIGQFMTAINLPIIPAQRFTTLYFLQHPGDIYAVWHIAFQLQKAGSLLLQSEPILEEIPPLIDKLMSVKQLQEAYVSITDQLRVIGTGLQAERAAGLLALSHQENSLQDLWLRLSELQRLVDTAETLTIAERDRLARALDSLEDDTQILNTNVDGIKQNRLSLDDQRQRFINGL